MSVLMLTSAGAGAGIIHLAFTPRLPLIHPASPFTSSIHHSSFFRVLFNSHPPYFNVCPSFCHPQSFINKPSVNTFWTRAEVVLPRRLPQGLEAKPWLPLQDYLLKRSACCLIVKSILYANGFRFCRRPAFETPGSCCRSQVCSSPPSSV